MCDSPIRPPARRLIAALLCLVMTGLWSGAALAVDLSRMPLDLQTTTQPASVMLIVDTSLPMDAEILTSESGGLFNGKAYLFPPEAYNNGPDHAMSSDLTLTPDESRLWRSQWAGDNRMYYDPRITYQPWPGTDQTTFAQADLQQPYAHPVKTGSSDARLRLSAVLFTVISDMVAIPVPVAHYFILDDLNANGRADNGEGIYLVLWRDVDDDELLDASDDPANDLRQYYRLEDDGDGRVEDGELVAVRDASEIDRIRPVVTDSRGRWVRYASDREDLQNFANWVTYYRRRILVVKAAASRYIAGAKGIRIGLYPVDGHDAQPVLPVGLPSGLVMDDRDENFASLGAWYTHNDIHAWGGSALASDQEGAVALFRPDLPYTGRYAVSLWWPCGNGAADEVDLEIATNGGRDVVYRSTSQSRGCGQWIELGAWPFAAGSGNVVRIICPRDGQTVWADAVRFQYLDGEEDPLDQTDDLLNRLYDLEPRGAKNLRAALDNVGRYFDLSRTSDIGVSPLATAFDGGGCQHLWALLVSDGIWEGAFSGVGNTDRGQGRPFADLWPDTLADVAMHYFLQDPAMGLPNQPGGSVCDGLPEPHMATYAIALGGMGLVDRDDIDGDGRKDRPGYARDASFVSSDTPAPEWPQPVENEASCIDDFWHATVNGRGLITDAGDSHRIQARIGRTPPVAHPEPVAGQMTLAEDLARDRMMAFQTRYHGDAWRGDVLAFRIASETDRLDADPEQAVWRAARELERYRSDPDGRRIITYGGRSGPPRGIPFRYDDLSDTQQALLGSDLKSGSDADAEARDLLDYLRGAEDQRFRPREQLLGDIVNSVPVVSGDTLYVGANDGMLHAFNAQDGSERFAYVPSNVLGHMKELARYDYRDLHRFFVDGAPTAGEVLVDPFKRNTYLVVGFGKGGQGYACLLIKRQVRTLQGDEPGPYEIEFDVDRRSVSDDERSLGRIVQWEYPSPDTADDGLDNDGDGPSDEYGEYDPDIGYSVGRGYAVNGNVHDAGAYRPMVVFPNGYNSAKGSAVLYILDAVSGEIIRKIDTGRGGDNGLSVPALIDVDADRRIDYAYAGDLQGNLWKFDLTSGHPGEWGLAYGEDLNGDGVIDAAHGDRPEPVFTAVGQAITARPDVMFARNSCAPLASGFMVVFGTGRYLGLADRHDHRQQSVYGIWDYGDDGDDSETLGALKDRVSGTLSSGYRLVPQTIVSMSSVDGTDYRRLSTNTVRYDFIEDSLDGDGVNANNQGQQQPDPVRDAGWFLDFPPAADSKSVPGERVIGDVTLRGGKLVVTSYTPAPEPWRIGGQSWLYLIDACFSATSLVPEPVESRASIMALQTGRRFEGRLGILPAIFKDPGTPDLDQMLIYDASGRLIKIPFRGETWGRVFWRQNIQ